MELLELPVNTKVLVTEDGKLWLRRYLHHTERSLINPNQILAVVFPMGCDEWTFKNYKGSGMNPRLTVWTKWVVYTEGMQMEGLNNA